MLDGISLFALVVIACFMVDRTARVIAVSLVRVPKAATGETEASTLHRQHIAYLIVAALLSGVVLAYYGKVTIFHALGFNAMPPLLDTILTAVILTAGADTIGQYLMNHVGGRKPLEVVGRLTLDNETSQDGSSR